MSAPVPPPEFTDKQRTALYTEYALAVDEWLKAIDARRGSSNPSLYMVGLEKEKRVRELHARLMNPEATPTDPT